MQKGIKHLSLILSFSSSQLFFFEMSSLKNLLLCTRFLRLSGKTEDSFSCEQRSEDGKLLDVNFTLQLKFLDFFLWLQNLSNEQDMLDVTEKVQALFEDDAVVGFLRHDKSDPRIFLVKQKFCLIKREIKAKYSFPKISSSRSLGIDVIKFVDTVVHNIRYLVNDVETKELIYDVFKEMKLLQTLVCFVSGRFTEPPNFFLAHVLAVAGHTSMVAWLYFSGGQHQGETDARVFLQMKFQLIQPSVREIYIALLQDLKSKIQSQGYWCRSNNIQNDHEHSADIEANFLETIQHHFVKLPVSSSSCCNSSQRVALTDRLEILREVLNFLRSNITLVSVQDLDPLLQDIDDVIIDAGLLVYSLYEGKEEEEEKEVNATQLVDMSANINRIIPTMIKCIRKQIQHNLPRIHGLGYVDFLLTNLEELQCRYAVSLAYVENQLQIIQKELKSLQPFLKVVLQEPLSDLNVIVQRCATQVIDKAYEIEYIVDACINEKYLALCIEYWLFQIIEEITIIREKVVEIHENKKVVADVLMNNTVKARTSSNFARSPRLNDKIVGFEEEIKKLRHQLINGSKERVVIPIVGMPGLGKTTLAYRLYSDRSVVSHFTTRAECCVSQVYSRKDLLLKILSDVITGEDKELADKLCKDREKYDDHELADKLRKALFSKRYLILIDDLWELNAWDDLIGCYPDEENGSRIILTTRNHEVAEYARLQSDPLQLRMFNEDESWELLRWKVFGKVSCPPLLKNIGQKIAKKCGQLPLSVVLVSGILAEMDKKEECWKQLASNLGPHIHQDSRAIVEQSYEMLPYHLRSCFLYFGAFLEDSAIDVSKLIRLWISEGFVKSCNGKTLEEIAEGYLENLFGRNLVMKNKMSCGGEIKTCRLHDVLHDFCKERANKENLLQCIKRDNYQSTSPPIYRQSNRLCISRSDYCLEKWSSCSPLVGSIINVDFYKVPIDCYNFKFLKVLDFEFSDIGVFPTDLVYLRYFAATLSTRYSQFNGTSISSFLTGRWNLETMILKDDYYNAQRISVPIALLCRETVKLRHLHISNCEFTTDYAEGLLQNLQTLSTPYFSSVEDVELILRVTPNLRKLSFQIDVAAYFQNYVLIFPARIETLKIYGRTKHDTIPFRISAPNLKKLTLEVFALHPHDLSEIALLQNLQVLKLKNIWFGTTKWSISNGEFPQLKVLKLDGIDWLKVWHVSDYAFPHLRRLVLRQMYRLKEIPSCFEDNPSLKYIEVKKCSVSLEESARHIWKTQVEDYENHSFEVFLQNNITDDDHEDNGGSDDEEKDEY